MNNRITKVLKKFGVNYKEFGDDTIEYEVKYGLKFKRIIYHVIDDDLELVIYQEYKSDNLVYDELITYEMAVRRILRQVYEVTDKR